MKVTTLKQPMCIKSNHLLCGEVAAGLPKNIYTVKDLNWIKTDFFFFPTQDNQSLANADRWWTLDAAAMHCKYYWPNIFIHKWRLKEIYALYYFEKQQWTLQHCGFCFLVHINFYTFQLANVFWRRGFCMSHVGFDLPASVWSCAHYELAEHVSDVV